MFVFKYFDQIIFHSIFFLSKHFLSKIYKETCIFCFHLVIMEDDLHFSLTRTNIWVLSRATLQTIFSILTQSIFCLIEMMTFCCLSTSLTEKKKFLLFTLMIDSKQIIIIECQDFCVLTSWKTTTFDLVWTWKNKTWKNLPHHSRGTHHSLEILPITVPAYD